MKTRLDEVRRLQKLAGITSSNYRFLREEEEEKAPEGEKSEGDAKDQIAKIEKKVKNMEIGDKAIAALPEPTFDINIFKDPKNADASKMLAVLKKKLPDEEYKKAEQNIKKIQSGEGEKEPVNEEGMTATVIAVLSLIPLVLELMGSISNGIYKYVGLSKDERAKADELLKKLKDAEDVLDKLKKQRKETGRSSWVPSKAEMDASDKIDAEKKEKQKAKERLARMQAAKKEKTNEDREEGKNVSGSDYNEELETKIVAAEKRIERINKIYAKKYQTQIGHAFKEAGHKLHAAYTSPIRGLLWLSGMWDGEKREKYANIIYAIIMIAYGLKTGLIGAMKESLMALNGVRPAFAAIVHSLEGGKSLGEIFKNTVAAIKG